MNFKLIFTTTIKVELRIGHTVRALVIRVLRHLLSNTVFTCTIPLSQYLIRYYLQDIARVASDLCSTREVGLTRYMFIAPLILIKVLKVLERG